MKHTIIIVVEVTLNDLIVIGILKESVVGNEKLGF
jgi:hypothetical protein